MKSLLVLALQAALAAALLLPTEQAHFVVRPAWRDVGTATALLGLLLCGIAALQLGPELTPSPDPKPSGRVHAEGLYRYVRHPIYSGLLLAAAGFAIRSGNLFSILTALAIAAFFHAKARYEERELLRLHPEYADYLQRTPRFVPRLGA